MFKNLQLPICPYCGRNLNFFESWLIHKNGEYVCPDCECLSRIELGRDLKKYAVITIVISLFFAVFSFFAGDANFFEIILVVVPFLLFYFIVPYTILLKSKSQNEPEDYQRKINEYEDEEYEDMMVYKINNSKGKIFDDPLGYDDIEKTKVF